MKLIINNNHLFLKNFTLKDFTFINMKHTFDNLVPFFITSDLISPWNEKSIMDIF